MLDGGSIDITDRASALPSLAGLWHDFARHFAGADRLNPVGGGAEHELRIPEHMRPDGYGGDSTEHV
jgi:hypothetical protein